MSDGDKMLRAEIAKLGEELMRRTHERDEARGTVAMYEKDFEKFHQLERKRIVEMVDLLERAQKAELKRDVLYSVLAQICEALSDFLSWNKLENKRDYDTVELICGWERSDIRVKDFRRAQAALKAAEEVLR